MSAEAGIPPGMDMSSPEAQAAAAEGLRQLHQLWSVISDIRLTKVGNPFSDEAKMLILTYCT
jgi:hypothetical protein